VPIYEFGIAAIEIADIKAARQEALLGSCRGIGPAVQRTDLTSRGRFEVG
jgi:hypothetical protein